MTKVIMNRMAILHPRVLTVWLAIFSSIAFARPRVIGGSDANKGRFEYGQVSLQLGGLHVCGGTLISSNLVLSAAHCRKKFDTVVVNAYNLSDSSEARQQFKPYRLFLHPAYNKATDTHDAMIVEVDGTIDDIDPVVINKYSTIPNVNDTLVVLGWGMTVFRDESSYPEILQIAELDYIPNDACKSMTNKNGQTLGDWILEDHLCAWEERMDACSGDSGSPLILPGLSREGDVLIGVVSWGLDCAGPLPGVYSRTSFIHSWLEEVICALSSAPPDNMECGSYRVGTQITPNITHCIGCGPKERQGDDESSNSESNRGAIGNGITWFSFCALNLIFSLCI